MQRATPVRGAGLAFLPELSAERKSVLGPVQSSVHRPPRIAHRAAEPRFLRGFHDHLTEQWTNCTVLKLTRYLADIFSEMNKVRLFLQGNNRQYLLPMKNFELLNISLNYASSTMRLKYLGKNPNT